MCNHWSLQVRKSEPCRLPRNKSTTNSNAAGTPLLFFLKCLEADDARLPELIRDEIQAGTFFTLCNTRASRRSKWVKQEILGGR